VTATLDQSQMELPRLVELASQGEDVLITIGGRPKARLTRAEAPAGDGASPPVDMGVWLKELEEVRRQHATGRNGPTVEQILDEDRADRR